MQSVKLPGGSASSFKSDSIAICSYASRDLSEIRPAFCRTRCIFSRPFTAFLQPCQSIFHAVRSRRCISRPLECVLLYGKDVSPAFSLRKGPRRFNITLQVPEQFFSPCRLLDPIFPFVRRCDRNFGNPLLLIPIHRDDNSRYLDFGTFSLCHLSSLTGAARPAENKTLKKK